VGALLHHLDVLGRRVFPLAIYDRIHKP
jgi:hypothetical protein